MAKRVVKDAANGATPTLEQQQEDVVSTDSVYTELQSAMEAERAAAMVEVAETATRAGKKPRTPREPKAPRPSAKTLDSVIARQQQTVGLGHVLYIATRAKARVDLGQSVEDAVNEVVAQEADAAKGALNTMLADGGDLRSALLAWVEANFPASVARQHSADDQPFE